MVLLHKLLLILSKINVTRQATGLFSNLGVAGTLNCVAENGRAVQIALGWMRLIGITNWAQQHWF